MLKGTKHSIKTRKKISKSKIGKRNSIKTEFKKGRIPWNSGLKMMPLSEDRKKQNSEFMKRYRKTHPNPMDNPNTVEKMIKSCRGKLSPKTTGRNHWNWKGGISSTRHRLQQSAKWKQWSREVFKRDNYICQKCGKSKCILNAHHLIIHFVEILNCIRSWKKDLNIKYDIYEFALRFEPLWDINNGQTLCVKCHKEIHSKKS